MTKAPFESNQWWNLRQSHRSMVQRARAKPAANQVDPFSEAQPELHTNSAALPDGMSVEGDGRRRGAGQPITVGLDRKVAQRLRRERISNQRHLCLVSDVFQIACACARHGGRDAEVLMLRGCLLGHRGLDKEGMLIVLIKKWPENSARLVGGEVCYVAAPEE